MIRNFKKLISFFLALALLIIFPLYPAHADSSGICFTAVNDKVLLVSMMPVPINGAQYVRCEVFKELGISYTYFASENAALLNRGSTQLVFYLNDGTCMDGDNKEIPLSATTINGAVYVPSWTGKYFGLVATLIPGTGYGDLLRIKDGTQVLGDTQFMEAASGLVLSRYLEYTGNQVGGGNSNPPITQKPDETEPPETVYVDVYLSFIGMPSAETMNLLKNYNAYATFFVTASEARDNPDMVRRIIGEGCTIGIYCERDPEAECEDAIGAIKEAAFYMPTIMTSISDDSSEYRQFAEKNGLVFYSPGRIIPEDTTSASAVITKLSGYNAEKAFCLYTGENSQSLLPAVLQYFSVNGYIAAAVLEPTVKSLSNGG